MRPCKDLGAHLFEEVLIIIIYKCTFPNGKVYIGQTSQCFAKRIEQHISDAFHKKYKRPFHAAIRKYGRDSLSWDIIDYAENQAELDEKEKYWIAYFNSFVNAKNSNGYNASLGRQGVTGMRQSRDTIEKIGKSGVGEKNSQSRLTDEIVLKIVEMSKTLRQVEISKRLSISESQISKILHGSQWNHVTNIKSA